MFPDPKQSRILTFLFISKVLPLCHPELRLFWVPLSIQKLKTKKVVDIILVFENVIKIDFTLKHIKILIQIKTLINRSHFEKKKSQNFP